MKNIRIKQKENALNLKEKAVGVTVEDIFYESLNLQDTLDKIQQNVVNIGRVFENRPLSVSVPKYAEAEFLKVETYKDYIYIIQSATVVEYPQGNSCDYWIFDLNGTLIKQGTLTVGTDIDIEVEEINYGDVEIYGNYIYIGYTLLEPDVVTTHSYVDIFEIDNDNTSISFVKTLTLFEERISNYTATYMKFTKGDGGIYINCSTTVTITGNTARKTRPPYAIYNNALYSTDSDNIKIGDNCKLYHVINDYFFCAYEYGSTNQQRIGFIQITINNTGISTKPTNSFIPTNYESIKNIVGLELNPYNGTYYYKKGNDVYFFDSITNGNSYQVTLTAYGNEIFKDMDYYNGGYFVATSDNAYWGYSPFNLSKMHKAISKYGQLSKFTSVQTNRKDLICGYTGRDASHIDTLHLSYINSNISNI